MYLQGTELSFLLFSCIFKGLNRASFYSYASSSSSSYQRNQEICLFILLLDLCFSQRVSSTSIFGLIHILIGSDILCSPRGFGPSWILKTCLDFSTYLFHHEWGIQLLWKDNPQSRGSFLRFMLALFKKRYSSKIKRGPEELLSATTM